MDRIEIKELILKAKIHNGEMGLVFDYKYNNIDCICKLYNLETFYRADAIKNSINIFIDTSSKNLNICPKILFVLEVDKIIILIMEKIKGISFLELYEKNLSIENTSIIIESLYKNIKLLHNLGYAHCDLNPNNIIIDYNNNVIIIDFDEAEKKDYLDSFNVKYIERDIMYLKYHTAKLLFKNDGSLKYISEKKFELCDVYFYKQNKDEAVRLYNMYNTIKNDPYPYPY